MYHIHNSPARYIIYSHAWHHSLHLGQPKIYHQTSEIYIILHRNKFPAFKLLNIAVLINIQGLVLCFPSVSLLH
jgi:hypothetical protein